MSARPNRQLVKGEVVRLEPDGPSYTVLRVNAFSATIRGTVGAARRVVFYDDEGNVERSFDAAGRTRTLTVSPFAFVYRDEGVRRG